MTGEDLDHCGTAEFYVPPIPDGQYDAYLFDCDGTLADSMPLHYLSWQMALAPLGLEFPKDLFYQWGGKTGPEIVRDFAAIQGGDVDIEAVIKRKQRFYLENVHRVQPVRPVLELAKNARGKIPMAVVSGGHRRLVHGTLTAIGAISWFETIVCAEDYARGKPSPDPFLEAARQLGVPPKNCLVFEDTDTGIAAATSAGMRSLRVEVVSR